MHPSSAKKAVGRRVYQAIKERVVAYDFAPGQRIYLEPIAKQLGVSLSPVQAALNRLAAEGLVIKASRKGFIAMTLSEDNLVGHYELTRQLLIRELGQLGPTPCRKLSENESIAHVLNKLNRRVPAHGGSLATYTGEIFACIASLAENDLVVQSINRANDHLFYIRTVECQILDSVQRELTYLCELVLAAQREELISAIHAYHDKRLLFLQTLLNFMRQ